MPDRRRVLSGGFASLTVAAAPAPAAFAPVKPGVTLRFPADHGAHPDFRTEWWYVTGWLKTADGGDLGFQVTFFRSRTGADPTNPSAFAPRQVLFAHAALSDPKLGRLRHDQRIARAGFGLAEASTSDTDIVLDDWRLKRRTDGGYAVKVQGREFALDLALVARQPLLLQGDAGYSRKGPLPGQASYYYSVPHLAVSGAAVQSGRRIAVSGEAWLDREWSSTLLDTAAVGWDWAGLNLDDGGALTAFQVRDAVGRPLWAGGSFRAAGKPAVTLGRDAVQFTTERTWRSPRTNAVYPVQRLIHIRLPQGVRSWRLTPLFDDQELDGRPAGPVYWEGAVRTSGGRGYLELTGYLAPLSL